MMSAGARVRALVGDACHSDLARRKAAFWRALCIVGPGSAVGQPAALVWRRARHSRRWQSVCCTIHTSCRPAALGSDQSCLAMAYMCVSLDVRCTKINLQTGRRTGWSHAGTPGTATPTPHASPVIHNVVIHVKPFRARVPRRPNCRLIRSVGPSGAQLHSLHSPNELIDSLILLTVRGRVSGLLT